MPTTKQRINVSLAPYITNTLQAIAERDHVPTATKAAYFLQLGLETEEDDVFNRLAMQRDTKTAKFISHQAAW